MSHFRFLFIFVVATHRFSLAALFAFIIRTMELDRPIQAWRFLNNEKTRRAERLRAAHVYSKKFRKYLKEI